MKDKKIEEQENNNLQLQNNKKVQKLKEKGITLIALVVTIIILLILVGVTISQITGENGLIRKAKEAVERYKNATEEEQIQLGQLEQYVSDFSIVGGEGDKVLVSIKSLELTGNTEEQQIIVKVTVRGEASGVEYKINSEEEWTTKENEGTEKEESEGEKETEYTHTFEGLEIGKSYYVRVKVYDTNGKYEEAISDVVTLGYIMTAEDKDVLETKTYIGKTGTKSIGSMPNNGEVNEDLKVGETYMVQKGYYSGGTITAGLEELEELKEKVENLERENDSLKSIHSYATTEKIVGTWIDGKPIYRKTCTGKVVDPDYNTIDTIENIDKFLGIDAQASYVINGSWQRPVTTLYCFIVKGGNKIELTWNGNSVFSIGDTYAITIQYTKLTD